MKIVVITGNTGTGKTTLAKKFLLRAKNPVVFDINNEYSFVKNNFFDPTQLLDFLENTANCTVLIDEATAFFSYKSYNEQLNKLLQLRRHRNHFFIFVYHSINFVPAYLRRYVNYYIFFQQGYNDVILKELNIDKNIIPAEKYKYNIFKYM